MCTLDEFQEQNKKEHEAITNKLKQLEPKIDAAASISQTIKWIAGGLLLLIVALLSVITMYSGMIYKATAHAKDVEVSSFIMVHALSDTIAAHWQIETKRYNKEIKPQEAWTHSVYKNEISTNTKRSKGNEKRILKVEKKIGLY